MKKIFIILPLVLLFAACSWRKPEPSTSVKGVSLQYNSAREIRNEYTLAGLVFEKNRDDQNEVVVQVGNPQTKKFTPEVKVSKWDGEVSFSVKPDLSDIPDSDKILTLQKDKIIYDTPKINYQLYNKPDASDEGGYEFEITLKEKPLTNVVKLTLQTKGLNFFYQAPLNKEIPEALRPDTDHCTETDCFNKAGTVITHRPENVVGSYAVYHQTKRDNQTGGKNYKTGKVAHIYRPRIQDSAGTRVWGDLDIDPEKGLLTVTIPQDFLDTAVYPVRHAAGLTIGYTTAGGTEDRTDNCALAARFASAEAGDANPGTAFVYGLATVASLHTSFAPYRSSGNSIVNQPQVASPVTITLTNEVGWRSAPITWNNILNATDYFLAFGGDVGARTYYDTSTASYNDMEYVCGGRSPMLDNPWGASSSASARQGSWYVDYTALADKPLVSKAPSRIYSAKDFSSQEIVTNDIIVPKGDREIQIDFPTPLENNTRFIFDVYWYDGGKWRFLAEQDLHWDGAVTDGNRTIDHPYMVLSLPFPEQERKIQIRIKSPTRTVNSDLIIKTQ